MLAHVEWSAQELLRCSGVLSLLSMNNGHAFFLRSLSSAPSTRSRVGVPGREGFTKGGGLIDQQHCPS